MSPALPPLVGDLERRLGLDAPLSGADAVRAAEALGDATALALAEVPTSLAEAWTAATPRTVLLVILHAARREFENPSGLRTETVGEVSTTVAIASGVYLTEAERAIVRTAATGRRGGFVGSIRTPSAYATT